MRSIKQVEKYFESALSDGSLRFTLDLGGGGYKDAIWLTVEVKTPQGAMPSQMGANGYKYTLVCAQDITDYKTPIELCNRITNMLTEQLLSSRQDVNIMYQEWQPKNRAKV